MTEVGASRLLVVDDDEPLQKVLARVLRPLGTVDTAGDGTEAEALLGKNAYDAIVSDISLPGKNGIQLLRTVREHDLDVPVILITGDPALETAIEALEYGAFRYFVKPIDTTALLAAVKRALGSHKMAKLKRQVLELDDAPTGHALGDRAALEARFASALEKLWIAFQPIVSWSSRDVYAYEALVRTDEPTLRSPLDLFDAAERLERVHDLGRQIRAQIAAGAASAPEGVQIFVNCHPDDLRDDELISPDAPLTALAAKVVLEITERSSLEGVSGVQARIAALRDLGFRIALDDLGAGYAGLSCFTLLEPDFVKLDRSLVQNVDKQPKKRRIVRAMLELCRKDLEMKVVGEGVETAGERDALVEDGCELLQGWLFAKAERGFQPPKL